jgi:hypothetical protein
MTTLIDEIWKTVQNKAGRWDWLLQSEMWTKNYFKGAEKATTHLEGNKWDYLFIVIVYITAFILSLKLTYILFMFTSKKYVNTAFQSRERSSWLHGIKFYFPSVAMLFTFFYCYLVSSTVISTLNLSISFDSQDCWVFVLVHCPVFR